MKNKTERIVLIVILLISFLFSATSFLRTMERDDNLTTIGQDDFEMTMLYQEGGQVVVGTHSAHAQFLSDSILLRGERVYIESQIYSNGERGLSDDIICGEKVLMFQNGIFVGEK